MDASTICRLVSYFIDYAFVVGPIVVVVALAWVILFKEDGN